MGARGVDRICPITGDACDCGQNFTQTCLEEAKGLGHYQYSLITAKISPARKREKLIEAVESFLGFKISWKDIDASGMDLMLGLAKEHTQTLINKYGPEELKVPPTN